MIVLAVIGALVPVAVFVSTATRLSAARREQRLAALRLVGATAAQVTRLAAVESFFVSVIGVVAGIGLFLLTAAARREDPARQCDLVPWLDRAAARAGHRASAPDPGRRRGRLGCRSSPRRRDAARRAAAAARRGCRARAGSSRSWFRSWCCPSRSSCVRRSAGISRLILVGIVIRRRHHRDRSGRSVVDVPRRSRAARPAGWRLDAPRLAPAHRRSACLVRGDRRVIMAVFVASTFFSFVAYAEAQNVDRGGSVAADQVYVEMPLNEGPAVRRCPGPDRGRAGRPFRCCRSRPPSSWRTAPPRSGSCRASTSHDSSGSAGRPTAAAAQGLSSLLGSRSDSRSPARTTLIPGPRRAPCRSRCTTAAPLTLAAFAGPGWADSQAGLPQLIIEPDALRRGPVAVADQVLRHDRWLRRRPGSGSGPPSSPSVPTAYVRLAAESRADLAGVRGIRAGRRSRA